MTRIIGGVAGGRRLATPRGDRTRPTSERVREALFSAVEADLGSWAGRRVLDLYAGSGAVGLEARSRGAQQVTLVERDARTAAVARRNVAVVGLGGVDLVTAPVARFLAGPGGPAYDVVFLDPPYATAAGEVRTALEALSAGGWLGPGGLVVLERSARDPAPGWPDGLVAGRLRRYGETTLAFATVAGPSGTGPEQGEE